MRRKNQLIASTFLSAALIVPIGALAIPAPQDDRDHERHEQEERQRRYYDQQYKDYHNWDDREDRAYRQWLADRNNGYVEYGRLTPRDQQEYWRWRHKQEKRDRHEEHEEHEHDHN